MTKLLIKGLFVLLLLMPAMVMAEELPKDSFAYFLLYPNNVEIGVGDYEEAIHPSERLLYVGKTNQNGEVVLEGWNQDGKIRIEYLSNSTNAELIQRRVALREDLDNPKTGQAYIFILLFFVILMVGFVAIHRKKSAFMVLLMLLSICVVPSVYAEKDEFVITVNDQRGNPVKNAVVKIYGKPVKVEVDHAVLFKSGKGNFFDGTTEMFFRIPDEKCTLNDFINSLSSDQYQYYVMNSEGAYREGFYPGDYSIDGEMISDGDSYTLNWSQNDSSVIVSVDGNGGYFDFYGRTLESIKFYNRHVQYDNFIDVSNDFVIDGISDANFYSPYLDFEKVISGVSNYGNVAVGLDVTSKCNRFQENGMIDGDYVFGDVKDLTYYMCWNQQPDGIYVNDEAVFLGNVDTCFQESKLELGDGIVRLSRIDYTLNSVVSNHTFSLHQLDDDIYLEYDNKKINQLEVVQNGSVILSLSTSDFEMKENYYHLKESSKQKSLNQLFNDLNSSCVK